MHMNKSEYMSIRQQSIAKNKANIKYPPKIRQYLLKDSTVYFSLPIFEGTFE